MRNVLKTANPAETKSKLILSITLLSLCLFIVSCAVNPVTGKRELMFVSESQEVAMGKELYPNALWGAEGGGGEYKDERARAYLRDIILRIHGVSHRHNLPVSFAIQNSSTPNAWAIPGYVVITRGLLAALDSEAEFAFVMGHEMGHVSARHSAEQMTSSMLMQVGLAGLGIGLGGKSYSDLALNLGSIGGSLVLLKYSRGHELEADRLGVLYMTRLGYDPWSAVSAHKNLERVSQEYLKLLGKDQHERGLFENLLSTHPRTSVRIDEIEHIIRSAPPAPLAGDGKRRERFQEMIAGLKEVNELYLGYFDKAAQAFQKNNIEEADSLISRAISASQSQPPFYALKGFILLKKKDYSEAERNFNRALDLDGDYEPALRGLGAVQYSRGSYSESIRTLRHSLTLFPGDVLSHYFLGMSYFKTRDYKQAVRHLKPVAEAQPKHPEIHGMLGMSYEHLNDSYSAYNEYIRQVNVAPDNEMGRYAASRAMLLKSLLEERRKAR